ncbi:MAG: DNA adenine methylase [Oscillatoriales cyanobacterium]|nr:MAG: DNA adenine methylase [Oscillatoriales cyanobacterium]
MGVWVFYDEEPHSVIEIEVTSQTIAPVTLNHYRPPSMIVDCPPEPSSPTVTPQATIAAPIDAPATGIAHPFVKWVGGKRGIIQTLLDHLPLGSPDYPVIDRYYEPFTGGGALFFALQQRRQFQQVCLSDINADLITAYRVIQSDPDALISALGCHAQNHGKSYYYAIRQQHTLTDPIARAARLLYLNRTCYNGLYRVNRRGEFNVPMGRYKNPNIVQAENLRACHHVLQGVTIEHHPFDQITPPHHSPCLIYFDPPYHPNEDGSFTSYSKQGFTAADQTRLRDLARDLHERGHYVMLSNSNADLIRELYATPPFRIFEIHAPRLVNCKSNQRQAVGEVLITTYPVRKLR